MPPTYTITGGDNPKYRAMICGRTEDLAEILDYLVQEKSVALFGERRIGKTSLLYLLRDLLNGAIRNYQQQLIDQDFQSRLASLQAKVLQFKVLHINLHALPKTESSALTHLLALKAQNIGLLTSPQEPSSQVHILTDLFAVLAEACGTTHQLVILIDEMEVLQDFADHKQVLRILRSTVLEYSCIRFVLVGAESWYHDYQEKSSRLHDVLDKKFLQAPMRSSMDNYLITKPLADYLSPMYDSRKITPLILEWTGCKPMYVQAICGTIVHLYQKHGHLPDNWETHVQEKLYEQCRRTIEGSYKGENIDELSQKILFLLAHRPYLTIRQIADQSSHSEEIVTAKIKDLLAFYKISRHNEKYRIIGTFIEKWGKENLGPSHNPWPQRIRWASAGLITSLIIIITIFTFWYTYPPQQSATFSVAQETISVVYPTSVEQGEIGAMDVSVRNNGTTAIKDLQMTFSAPGYIVYYTKQDSNQLTFDTIAVGEERSATISYRVYFSGNSSN